jgi:hypothetical protein
VSRLSGAIAWVREQLGGEVLTVIAIVSGVAFLLGLIVTPLVLIRLPADYFVRRDSSPPAKLTVGRVLVLIARNVLGAVLVLIGIALLVLPGQGLITLLVGLLVLDFRGKRAWERRLVARPGVLRFINRLRARSGRAPLEMPHQD